MAPGGAGARAPTVRLGARSAGARDPGALVRPGAPAVADHPPHHRGRVVDGAAATGNQPVVRGVCARAAVAAAGLADPVCGFCLLAAGVVTRRRAAAAAGVLAGGVDGGARGAGPAYRQAAAGRAELSRRHGVLRAARAVGGAAESAGAPGPSPAVSDYSSLFCCISAPCYGAGQTVG